MEYTILKNRLPVMTENLTTDKFWLFSDFRKINNLAAPFKTVFFPSQEKDIYLESRITSLDFNREIRGI